MTHTIWKNSSGPGTLTMPCKVICIIAGGRDYQLTRLDKARLAHIHIDEVVSGGAPGADRGGEEWAAENGIPVKRFSADWTKYGKAAGPIRNREMAEYANTVVLFPGGRGTTSMKLEAKRKGLKIYNLMHPKGGS
jgi:hypothetical protein